MKIVVQILMAVSGIALILAGIMGLDIISNDILNISGRGFLELSIATVLYAVALHVIQPFGGQGGGAEE